MSDDKRPIDPWSSTLPADYETLMAEFGIEPVTDELISNFPLTHRLLRRKVEFGHRDLSRIVDNIRKNEAYAVMSGIKPTGEFHLGTMMTAEEIIFYQSLSSKSVAHYCIADLEALADNGIPLEESHEIAVGNVADLLALGLDYKRAYIYKQSEEKSVQKMAFVFSTAVTFNMLEAIYGPKQIKYYLSALIQVGDIMLPQTEEHGGPKPVLVPVGIDQDPHIRLSRDIAKKFKFIPPSAVFHKLTRSLLGEEKMSKRNPMSMMTLSDDPELARRKVWSALTGGRGTVEEQRRLGGEPEKCVVFELMTNHFIDDDDELRKIYWECRTGIRLCGDCKSQLADIVSSFLMKHQQKREDFMDLARSILEGNE
ncbi:MAG: tryptophan--tRNA ligase [Nitrososphaerota archaeon]|nr:tryptophan--tRNA ligase [Aigarchaeota archaeon]MDW8077149.1 tryptophan--tRNA ligase [Nitrososphaerota archaeon]